MSKLNLKTKLLGLALAAGIVLVPAVHAVATWGPNRPTFTWAHPATYITFNSITDNPQYGDERTFFDGTYVSNPGAAQDKLTVSNDNQELSLRVYFHNNAASNLNLVAKNTKVQIKLPTQTATNSSASAYIMADNATPFAVGDTVDFTGSEPFTLEYENGSAQLWNNIFRGAQLSDSVVSTDGALVGYDKIDGKVPGCEKFSGFVTIKVRVHMQHKVTPEFNCNLLSVDKLDGRKVNASVSFTAKNGATLSSTKFDWGDGSTPFVTSGTTGSHTYGADGTFDIRATLTFNVGDTTATSSCSKSVTFTTPPPETPPSTPPSTPQVGKEIPNTGAGSVVALFSGVSLLAGAGHYLFNRRARN